MKRQKPNPDTTCGHMPMNTVSREAMIRAAYEPEKDLDADEKKLRAVLQQRAERCGFERVGDLPEFFVSLQYCVWTQADMSDVSWDNLSHGARLIARYVKAHKPPYQVVSRYAKDPILEKRANGGAFYIIPHKKGCVEKGKLQVFGNCYLTRVFVSPDKFEVGDTISDFDDKLMDKLFRPHDFRGLREFLFHPVHHLSETDLTRLIDRALELHPDWLPNVLQAITNSNYTARYLKTAERALNDKVAAASKSLTEMHLHLIGWDRERTVEYHEPKETA